jgi:hypothetical protein
VDEQAQPGLREQLGATIEAAKRLVRAHVALGRAEASEIMGAVKKVVGMAFLALGLVIAAALILFIGGLLFLGEWLFGSIGWGVLLGSLLFIDLAVVALLAAVDVQGRRLARDLGVAAVLGGIVGVVLAFDLAHRTWASLGDSLLPGVDPAWRALLVAVIALAVVGAVLGLLLSARSGGVSVGGAVGGAIVGVMAGVVSAGSVPSEVGAALGVLVALLAWPTISGIGVARRGIDGEALKAKFTPEATIAETKETIEWARARLPLAPKS